MWNFLSILVIATITQATYLTDISKEVSTFNELKRRTRDGDIINVASGGSKSFGPFTATKTDSFSEIGLSHSNSKAKASDVDFDKTDYYDDMVSIYTEYKSGGEDTGKQYLEQAVQQVKQMSLDQIAHQLLTNDLTDLQFKQFQALLKAKNESEIFPHTVSNNVAVEFLEQAVTPKKSKKVASLDEFVKSSNKPGAQKLKDLYNDLPMEKVMGNMFGRFQMGSRLQDFMVEKVINPLYERFLNEDGTLKDSVKFEKSSEVEQVSKVDLEDQPKAKKNKRNKKAAKSKKSKDGTPKSAKTAPAISVKKTSSSTAEKSEVTSSMGQNDQRKKKMQQENKTSGRKAFWEYKQSDADQGKNYDPVYYNVGNRRLPGRYMSQDFDLEWDEFFEYATPNPMQWKTVTSSQDDVYGYEPEWKPVVTSSYDDMYPYEPQWKTMTSTYDKLYKDQPEPNVADAVAEAEGDQTFTDTLTEVEANKMSESQSVSISETTDKKRKICLKFELQCFCNDVDKCIKKKTISVCKRLGCKKEGFKCPYTYCEKSQCRVYEKHTFKCIESFCVKYSSEDCYKPKEDYFIRCLEYDFACREKQVCAEFAVDCIPHCERICLKHL